MSQNSAHAWWHTLALKILPTKIHSHFLTKFYNNEKENPNEQNA